MVDISFFTMILQWLNFGVLLIVLYFLLWKPLIKFLDERSGQIKKDLDEAKTKNEKAEAILAEYEVKTQEIQKEAEAFMKNAQRDALKEKNKILDAAEREVKTMMERAKKEITLEVNTVKEELKKEFSKTAVNCAEKILEKEISEKDHDRLINDFFFSLLK